VVTTVDALFGMGQLDEHFEAVKQVAVADRLLLTKTDLAPTATVAALRERLAALNPAADIVSVTHGELDPALIQNLGLWNAETRSLEVARWLKPQRYQPASAGKLGGKPGRASHDARIEAFTVVLDAPLDRYGLQSALDMLTSFRAENLLRFKAIVNLKDDPQPVVLHGVQHVLYPEVKLDAWPDDDRRSRFVFIVRDLDPDSSPGCWPIFPAPRAAMPGRRHEPRAKLLVGLIRVYQLALSPWLGRQCRYLPTCSEYGKEAIEKHGALKGSWLAAKRIGRCRPGCATATTRFRRSSRAE
jgi:putative membrane protein insertion efficiency factor